MFGHPSFCSSLLVSQVQLDRSCELIHFGMVPERIFLSLRWAAFMAAIVVRLQRSWNINKKWKKLAVCFNVYYYYYCHHKCVPRSYTGYTYIFLSGTCVYNNRLPGALLQHLYRTYTIKLYNRLYVIDYTRKSNSNIRVQVYARKCVYIILRSHCVFEYGYPYRSRSTLNYLPIFIFAFLYVWHFYCYYYYLYYYASVYTVFIFYFLIFFFF